MYMFVYKDTYLTYTYCMIGKCMHTYVEYIYTHVICTVHSRLISLRLEGPRPSPSGTIRLSPYWSVEAVERKRMRTLMTQEIFNLSRHVRPNNLMLELK